MNANFSRYASAVLPLAVLILGIFDAAQRSGTSLLGWQTILQLIILLATTGASFWLPLISGPWAGALKTGAAIVGAIASALIATIPDGHFTTATLILFLTAAVKAVAVQLGVSIRTDAAKVAATPDTAVHGLSRQDRRAILGLTVNGASIEDQPSEIVDPGADEVEEVPPTK